MAQKWTGLWNAIAFRGVIGVSYLKILSTLLRRICGYRPIRIRATPPDRFSLRHRATAHLP